MNIAIVDEEKIELETAEIFLRCYIKKFWSQYESSIHIEIFQSAEDFIQFFCAGLYHLVILGNHMEKTANFIRACGDYDTKIIFLKNNDDFKNEGGGIMNVAVIDDKISKLPVAENYVQEILLLGKK